MASQETIENLKSRKSTRAFAAEPLATGTLDALIDAARWAPSGMNNQPWRFVTIESRHMLDTLAGFTKYGKILKSAPAAIAVFLDHEATYNRDKDLQGIGAAVENLLVAAQAYDLGACWLGEILNMRAEVEKALAVPSSLELMALIAVGRARENAKTPMRDRLPLTHLIIGRF